MMGRGDICNALHSGLGQHIDQRCQVYFTAVDQDFLCRKDVITMKIESQFGLI